MLLCNIAKLPFWRGVDQDSKAFETLHEVALVNYRCVVATVSIIVMGMLVKASSHWLCGVNCVIFSCLFKMQQIIKSYCAQYLQFKTDPLFLYNNLIPVFAFPSSIALLSPQFD